LAANWQAEYEAIAELVAAAAIPYIDETGGKVGKRTCYTWIFSTLLTVLFKCGVGRGKEVLTDVSGERFPSTGTAAPETPRPNRWMKAHPEHRRTEREEESREAQAGRRRTCAARRAVTTAPQTAVGPCRAAPLGVDCFQGHGYVTAVEKRL